MDMDELFDRLTNEALMAAIGRHHDFLDAQEAVPAAKACAACKKIGEAVKSRLLDHFCGPGDCRTIPWPDTPMRYAKERPILMQQRTLYSAKKGIF